MTEEARLAFRAYHERALRDLLRHILPNNRFYASKLANSDLKKEGLTSLLAELPFTNKHELVDDQLQHQPNGTNLTYPFDQYARYHQTSATSGQPMRWLDTNDSWRDILDQWRTILKIWDVSASDRALFCFSFGPFLGFWSAFEAATQLGCLCLPGGGLDTKTRAALIETHQVTVLCLTPTYALRLGQQAKHDGVDTDSVKRIFVAGEAGGSIAAVRQQLSLLWPNAEIVDHHGMTEVGPVSFAWPKDTNLLRVLEKAFLVEIVDPESLRPVAEGERGELVLTTLKRYAMPLIRYRTGDLVEKAEAEPMAAVCSSLALRGGILSRIDDMVVVRGVNVFPAAIDEVVRQVGGIEEYRVRVSHKGSMTELQLEIELEPSISNGHALVQDLENRLRSAFSLRIPVIEVENGQLPRFELKAKRWIREDL